MDWLPSTRVVPWFLPAAAFAGILALGCTKSASGPTTTTGPAPLATITVTPNPATLFVLGTQQFTAVGKDGVGNVVAITPTWSVANGGGTINGSGVFVASSTAGTFANTVQAASGGISGLASVTVNVTGNATRFVFLNLPQTIPAGTVITPALQVAAEDALGNVVSSFNGPVTLHVPDLFYGQASGTTTVTAVNGVATFANLGIGRPGGLLVYFVATTTAVPAPFGESAMFDAPAGTPSKLAFVIQPASSGPAPSLCPNVNPVEVQVQDSAGNAVVTYTGTLALSMGTNPGGGVLSGRLTGGPSNYPGSLSNGPGNALLGSPPINLRIDQPGNGYTLVASGPGLASATSMSFDMPAPPACEAP